MDASHDENGIGEADSLGCQSARAEARSLLPLLKAGNTVDSIRELIFVAPRVEQALRAFALANPEEAYSVERILTYRCRVLQEFDRMVREGVSATPLVEVAESSPSLFTTP